MLDGMNEAQSIVNFLVLMNPVALYLYILPLKKQVGLVRFINIVARATLISFLVYTAFALSGEKLFHLLQIDFESFRIFGGLVVTALSLVFIIQGKKSLITTSGEVNRIAAEIALPFMVGAGTIAISIIIGRQQGAMMASIIIFVVMLLTFLAICMLSLLRHSLKPRWKIVFDQNAEILLRLNGFVIGAFGVNLIVTGIRNIML